MASQSFSDGRKHMPTKDFDLTHLQQWTVENDGSSGHACIHTCISETDYTYTYEPEYEEIPELTFRQKLALEWIIFKAWVKRVLSLWN